MARRTTKGRKVEKCSVWPFGLFVLGVAVSFVLVAKLIANHSPIVQPGDCIEFIDDHLYGTAGPYKVIGMVPGIGGDPHAFYFTRGDTSRGGLTTTDSYELVDQSLCPAKTPRDIGEHDCNAYCTNGYNNAVAGYLVLDANGNDATCYCARPDGIQVKEGTCQLVQNASCDEVNGMKIAALAGCQGMNGCHMNGY